MAAAGPVPSRERALASWPMTTLDRSAVDALLARARRDVDDGLLPACQVALALDGEVLVHEVFGDAGVDTRFTIFSATKPFIASLVWQLLADGALRPEQPVHDVIPEFGSHGKDAVTLDHVLLHTSGFPRAPLGPLGGRPTRGAGPPSRLAAQLGGRAPATSTTPPLPTGSSPSSCTPSPGSTTPRRSARRVLEPLGLTQFALGPAVGDAGATSPTSCSWASRPRPMSSRRPWASARSTSARSPTRRCCSSTSRPRARWACPEAVACRRPPTWRPSTRRSSTTRRACGTRPCSPMPRGWCGTPSPTRCSGFPINRTRGLIVAGDDGRANLRGLGRTVSPAAFGHNGAAGQVAWADPATGLSFCYLTNGRDLHLLREHRRTTAVASLAAVCAV